MDINQPISGIPSSLLPFNVLADVFMEAINDTPFAGLVGTDPYTSPIVLKFSEAGKAEYRWSATPRMNPEVIATDFEAYSTAVEQKELAENRVSLSKFKWEHLERFPDLQRLASPVGRETVAKILLPLARQKYAERFVYEVIKSVTFGSKGISGRYDITANGSMPLAGRCLYGTTNAGAFTAYSAANNATFPGRVHAQLNGITANLSVKAVRKLADMAIRRTPQPALHPAKIIKGDGFSERRSFYLFVSPESAEWLQNSDDDFKKQNFERGVELARQANPMLGDRIAAVIGDVTVIKTPELTEYAAFDQNSLNSAGPYHHGFLVGCDALRLFQSAEFDGMQIRSNEGSFAAEEDEAIKVLYSYFRGWHTPAYFNKVTGAMAGQAGVAASSLAESGIIHFITKVA